MPKRYELTQEIFSALWTYYETTNEAGRRSLLFQLVDRALVGRRVKASHELRDWAIAIAKAEEE